MRNTIYRYFFKEFISSFLLILLSVTVIIWIVQSVNYLNFVTEDGHSLGVYFTYSILNIPKVVTRLVPFVFLISLLVTILYFEKSNKVRLILVGSITLILLQALIHIGVNIRLFPTTGMTLPFLSYGGSSIVGTAVLCGIILNLTKRKIN